MSKSSFFLKEKKLSNLVESMTLVAGLGRLSSEVEIDSICHFLNIRKNICYLEKKLKAKLVFLLVIWVVLNSPSQLDHIGTTSTQFNFKLGLDK